MRINKSHLIYDKLKKAIIDGTYAVGDQLPNEQEISQKYGVSHATYNKSMERLANEGYIDRIPRKGSFVKERTREVKKSLTTYESFTDLVKHAGFEAKTQLLKYEYRSKTSLSKKIKSYFSDCEFLHYFERIRYADDRPICLTYTYFDPKYLEQIDPSKLNTSFSEILSTSNVVRDRSHIEITATVASDEQMELLKLKQDAVLKQTVFWYQKDQLIEVTYNFFIGDDFSIMQDMSLKYSGKTIKKELF